MSCKTKNSFFFQNSFKIHWFYFKIDLIYNRGCGSALLEHKRKLWDIASAMDAVTNVPITLKMRIGKDERVPVVHKWIHEAENYGLAALTVCIFFFLK